MQKLGAAEHECSGTCSGFGFVGGWDVGDDGLAMG
jgi:hypothetical protein